MDGQIDTSYDGPTGFGAGVVLNFALGGGWIDVALDAFFELLLAADTQATARLVNGFETAQEGYSRRIGALMDDLAEFPDQPGKVFQLARFKELEADLKRTAALYGQQAEEIIRQAQASAVHIANEGAEQAVIGGALDDGLLPEVKNYAKFPDRAFADMVGRLGDGSPLGALLNGLGDSAAKEVRKQLLQGVAEGVNTDVLGARIAKATGIVRHRAIAISRTSILSSFREASRRSYLANAHLVRGWVWQSSRDRRTCMACIARDGTVYPLSARMPAHVNCRCRMRPVLRNGKTLRRGSGREWFDEQSPDIQFEMLGPGTYKAWKAGELDIADLAGFVVDPKWGASSSRRSLADARKFVADGRPYHIADVPPGLLTVDATDYLPGQVEGLLADLKALKLAESQLDSPPDWLDDFADCMG